MRARYVFEKFSEGGDPIEDMGIGDRTISLINKLDKIAISFGFYRMEDISSYEKFQKQSHRDCMFQFHIQHLRRCWCA